MADLLPISRQDMKARGWDTLDVILVTGDAYVDHPSYGASVIGRVLEDAGYKVGIIAQPDVKALDDFKKLGRPRLFFGVSAGNLDSMVAHYTANQKPRSEDDYSPGGKAGLRPDRATLIYTNRIREAFPNAVVVIGGIEASLRRLAHYDYWTDKVKRSIILDSKADILVYGMGEKQVVEIAGRLDKAGSIRSPDGIRGTVIVRNSLDGLKDYIKIAPFEEAASDKDAFNAAFKTACREHDPFRGKTIVQKHGERFVVQFPPARPLREAEMDAVYGLGYARAAHPMYDAFGGVPGFETVKFSVISHRGCPGECSFCSLSAHQGRIVQSRSKRSILDEIKLIAGREDFRGTITDIGGPTANLYQASCQLWERDGACAGRTCLVPEKCSGLDPGYDKTLKLWAEAAKIPGVKNIFIGSGIRYDILTESDSDRFLKSLCEYHVSGQLKVAPEHTEDHILRLMNKPSFEIYGKFVKRFNAINRALGKEQFLVNYFIVGHPGATLEDALTMALALKSMDINPEQIQDYLPLPMTAAGCMYYTGKDPFTGKSVYVAKGRERTLQRALIQYRQPQNKRYVIEALRSLNKEGLIKEFYR